MTDDRTPLPLWGSRARIIPVMPQQPRRTLCVGHSAVRRKNARRSVCVAQSRDSQATTPDWGYGATWVTRKTSGTVSPPLASSKVKGATISIRALSWQFAQMPVIMGRGSFARVPRALPGFGARRVVSARRGRQGCRAGRPPPPGPGAGAPTSPSRPVPVRRPLPTGCTQPVAPPGTLASFPRDASDAAAFAPRSRTAQVASLEAATRAGTAGDER